MSQSELKTGFTKKSHRQIYSTITSNHFAITVKSKIVVIIEEFKDIDYVITNVFELANASEIILLTRIREILKEAQKLLKNIFVNIVFCYCSMNIINRKIMIGVFKFIRDTMRKSNVLIFDATYLHSLKVELDIFDEDLNRDFDVNFKTNVKLVRIFVDSRMRYSKIKIIINVSIVTVHMQQLNMSTYDASKAVFVHWLNHAQGEHRNVMRIYHMYFDIIRTNLLRDREFEINDRNWKNCKSRFNDILLWLRLRMAKLIKAHSRSSWRCDNLARFSRDCFFGRPFYLS